MFNLRKFAVSLLLVVPAAMTFSATAQDMKGVTLGPATIPLGENVGQLRLPQDFAFVNKEQANAQFTKEGDPYDKYLVGMVIQKNEDWYALIDYHDVGYVKDDEADHLNAESLLSDIKKGTAEANQERKAKGATEIEVVGWYRPPSYNHTTHILSWSVIGREAGQSGQVLNYTAEVLGRQGLMHVTVVGDYAAAAMLQPTLDRVISYVTFAPGRDYASFRPGDRVSDITMAGLVTGAAFGAAKLGLLAKLGNFLLVILLALKKMIVLVVIAIGAFFRNLKNRLTSSKPASSESSSTGPPPSE